MSRLPESLLNNGKTCRIGSFYNNKLDIIIWEDDKISEPHFHIIDSKTLGNRFHCRLLMKTNDYYKGETTKLNKRQINSLLRFLKSEHQFHMPNSRGITNWLWLLMLWNDNNKIQVRCNKKIPNYTTLN